MSSWLTTRSCCAKGSLALDGSPTLVVLTSSREASAYGPRLAASRALGFIPKDELSGAAIRALVANG